MTDWARPGWRWRSRPGAYALRVPARDSSCGSPASRLLWVVNEQQVTLLRTAFSTVVREWQDLACGVFDSRGQMVAQSLTGTPGHINAMATGVRHVLAAIPASSLVPGDVLITNDP